MSVGDGSVKTKLGRVSFLTQRKTFSEPDRISLIRGNYRAAFHECRKHRIDLNILALHNEAIFLKRLASFVDQVDDVDHINLFLTNVGCVSPW